MTYLKNRVRMYNARSPSHFTRFLLVFLVLCMVMSGSVSAAGAKSAAKTVTVKPRVNQIYIVDGFKYTITKVNDAKKTGNASLAGPGDKTVREVTMKETVKIGEYKFSINAISPEAFDGCKNMVSFLSNSRVKKIGARAFYNCKALKTLTIKSPKLKSVGSNALKGISSKAVVRACSSPQVALFKNKGQSSGVKMVTVISQMAVEQDYLEEDSKTTSSKDKTTSSSKKDTSKTSSSKNKFSSKTTSSSKKKTSSSKTSSSKTSGKNSSSKNASVQIITDTYTAGSNEFNPNRYRAGSYLLSTLAPRADKKLFAAFRDLGMRAYIDPSVSATGVFDVRHKSIKLKYYHSCIYHEVGHFLFFVSGSMDRNAEGKAIYNAEKGKVTSSNRTYTNQSSSEYFAEAYKSYVLERGKLAATRPKTYAYIKKALDRIDEDQVQMIKRVYSAEIW